MAKLTVDQKYELRVAKIKARQYAITTEWFGERCKDYEPECACCKAWVRTDILCELIV